MDMSDIVDVIFTCVFLMFLILMGVLVYSVITDDSISLGDEVRTSGEYNIYFNDSFSGRIIVTKDSMYTVRDMEGNEQTFEKKWLVKIDRE